MGGRTSEPSISQKVLSYLSSGHSPHRNPVLGWGKTHQDGVCSGLSQQAEWVSGLRGHHQNLSKLTSAWLCWASTWRGRRGQSPGDVARGRADSSAGSMPGHSAVKGPVTCTGAVGWGRQAHSHSEFCVLFTGRKRSSLYCNTGGRRVTYSGRGVRCSLSLHHYKALFGLVSEISAVRIEKSC